MRSLLQRSTLCCCRVVQNTLCCFRGVQKHKHLHSREMELNCRRTYWGEKRNDVTINCWFPLLDLEKPSSMLVWYDDWRLSAETVQQEKYNICSVRYYSVDKGCKKSSTQNKHSGQAGALCSVLKLRVQCWVCQNIAKCKWIILCNVIKAE